MGIYITFSDIYDDNLYGITAATANTATVNNYIDDAESVIDSYLGRRYSLPLASTPPVITKIAKALTICDIYSDLYPNDNANRNEWVEVKCENAKEMLDDIATGDMNLILSSTVVAPNTVGKLKTTREDMPLAINLDSEYTWEIPDNLLDEIDIEREAAS